jgi:hypothetical protein
VNLRLPFASHRATAYDPVNGVSQELVLSVGDGATVLDGVLVGDAPLIVRLKMGQ